MIFDAQSQNEQLSQAGNTLKDTSPRVEKAINESKKVTTKKEPGNTALDTGKRTISSSINRKSGGKPSFEGYMNSSSAHISLDNTGYAKKEAQKSRYSETPTNKFLETKNQLFPSSNISNIPNGNIGSGNVTNYSNFTQSGSSSNIISGIIRNNNII